MKIALIMMKYAIPALSVMASLLLAGCAAKQSTFQVYPPDALSTTASPAVVSEGIRQLHNSMGHHYEMKPDGSLSDPSFKQGSRWWSTGKSPKKSTLDLTRSTTEFRNGSGGLVSIEIIRAKNTPAIVIFTCEGKEGAMPVINVFVASLQKQGVKPMR